jgi:thiol-disulfide isomerase/thioredoxin
MTVFWVSYGVLWLVLAVQGFAFLEVIRQIGLLRQQVGPYQGAALVPTKIDMGDPLPELTAITAEDQRAASWSDYIRAPVGMVLFLSTHCLTCRDIAEGAGPLARELGDEASIVAVVEGQREEALAFARDAGLPASLVAIDEAGATAKGLGIQWSPAALSIREHDTLGTAALVNDIYQVDSFVSEELAKRNGDLAGSTA